MTRTHRGPLQLRTDVRLNTLRLQLAGDKMKAFCIAACLLATAVPLASPACAQDLARATEIHRAARAQLDRVDPTLQFGVSAETCLRNLSRRDRDASRAWCAIASRQAVSRLDRVGFPYDEHLFARELEVVQSALWLNAVDGLGLQNNPWWGAPRSETIPLRHEVRRLAYVVLADFNRGDWGAVDFNFERLALIIGINRASAESFHSFRLRVLDRLDGWEGRLPIDGLARSDIQWARAVTALTLFLDDGSADPAREAREIAARLAAATNTELESADGEDGALRPAFHLATGYATFVAGEPQAAEESFRAGHASCVVALWEDAALCSHLARAMEQSLVPDRTAVPADRLLARTLQRTLNPH